MLFSTGCNCCLLVCDKPAGNRRDRNIYASVYEAQVSRKVVTSALNETYIHSIAFFWDRPITNSEMAAYIQAVSVLVGAWLGAVVIPLDWERPWQQWPISCVLGAIVGQAIGSVGTTVLYFMPTTVENDDRKNQ